MSAAQRPEPGDAPRRRFLVWLPLIVFAVLAALFYVRLYTGDVSRIPSALIGKQVPDFSLAGLEGLRGKDGEPVPGFSAQDLKKGGVTLVNVWASWCGPCREEHPVLEQLAEEGLVLYGLNYKDDPDNARRFLGQLGNPFKAVGVDSNGRVAIDWGVYGVPETFVVRGDGTIAYKHVGPITPQTIGRLRDGIKAAMQNRAQ